MAQRRDWDALKTEFLMGTWLKVADFLRDKNLRDSGNTRAMTKGWAQERRSLRNEISNATQDAIKRKTVETQVSILDRHKKIWKGVEISALRHLEIARKEGKDIDPRVLKTLAETLKIATEGERLANGMSTAKTENVTENKSIDAMVAKLQKQRGLIPETPPVEAEFAEQKQLAEPIDAEVIEHDAA